MQEQIGQILAEARKAAGAVSTLAELEEFKIDYLGRKARLTNLLREIKDLPKEERAAAGQKGNEVRQSIEALVEKLESDIGAKEYQKKLQTEYTDITAVPSKLKLGSLHPLTQERFIVEDIFASMGFDIREPYLIDDEYHNFTSLNIPEDHPAKDMWDSILTTDNQYLITHTSSMQNRIIKDSEAPIRAIVPGRCFRAEATDRTHEHSFSQVEGIYVDKGIKLSDMLGVLQEFVNRYFETEIEVKVQPTFFPFVEPGMEMMMHYNFFMKRLGQKSSGLADKWIEIIPCGPIHPFVIKEAGLDPETYSGFAWGFGLDRLVMLKYAIDDIRLFHSGNLDFITQFSS